MKARGFNLLELIITISIIAILVAIAIPLYFDAIKQAKRKCST